MRINNNVMAMNTHRQYGVNNTNVSKSVEKLSSGYRVNRAGDDAAGLAISEKMRAQIRGLNMASKNSQDAISLVQTAEGALQTTHDILQRMRELAVQSASDSNESTIDRSALNKEFQALIAEIDDTAAKTKFNDMGVIDGSFQATKTQVAASSANLTAANVKVNPNLATGTYGMEVAHASGTAAVASLDNTGVSTNTNWNTPTFTNIAKDATVNGDWTITVNSNGNLEATKDGVTIIGDKTMSEINAENAGTSAGLSKVTFAGLGELNLSSTADGDAVLAANDEFEFTISNATSSGAEGAYVTITNPDTTISVYEVKDGDTELKTKEGIAISFGKAIDFSSISNAAGAATAMGFGAATGISLVLETAAGTPFVVQTGANKGDELAINIDSMDSLALGVDLSKVDSRTNAQNAIDEVNDAINAVSSQRADLGALQNRLEFKIANLDTSSENLQSAESRIRDLDMAKEMTNFTKNNILSQAATAMLAQANSLPQGVLQLLG